MQPSGDQLATLRHVVNTNRCTISVTQVDGSNRFIVVSAIDTLIKGACGQAVQNMNIMFGLDERAGLGLRRKRNDSTKVVIKIGGNEVDNEDFLSGLVSTITEMRDVQPIIVHGGGKEIARLQNALGLTPQFIEGLRVTDEPSLNVAEMVLSGLVNKRLVARLIHAGVPAVGLSGVDLGLIRVDKMPHAKGDLAGLGGSSTSRAEVSANLCRRGWSWSSLPSR